MGGSVPEIPGIKAQGDLLLSFQREVADLLNRQSLAFPGAQPVSFAARHKLELQKDDYYVCEKSDGIRCLMYMTREGDREVTYLIDRKNDYYWVQNLHFPLVESEVEFHIATLVDGELVNDTLPNGTVELRYLVFDCLMLDGNSLMHRTLDKRLAYFKERVHDPYKALYRKYPQEISVLPFITEFKSMEFSYAIPRMFQDILPNLPHGNDGLIFTCTKTPYQFGTDQHILKWKSENENSIDFRMHLDWPMLEPDAEDIEDGFTCPYPDYTAIPTIHLGVNRGGNDEILYGTIFVEAQEWEDMKALNKPLDDRIVECYLDQQNRWKFLRFRDDKKEANHISTVESVMESIQDKVSKDDLLRVAPKIRDSWKKRHASEEAKARQEIETRRAQSNLSVTNGQNTGLRNGSSSTKRKIEDDEDSISGHEAAKRKITPLSDN